MGYIQLQKDADGIVELIFDQPGKSVNIMGEDYTQAMRAAVAQLQQSKETITGIYVRSGKPGQFFAGGDINRMLSMDLKMDTTEKEEMFNNVMLAKAPLRILETLGVPVAVGINGPALGGGFEIALACHHRIALRSTVIGLPEAQLGLIPGADGLVRTTRLLGIQKAMEVISQGRQYRAEKALELGLLDAVVDSEEDMHRAAKRWIRENPDATQPWDKKGFDLPGGSHSSKSIQQMLNFAPLRVKNKTRGLMPAQQVITAAISDTSRVDFASAQRIEARYFIKLLLDQTARNLMRTFFVQMNDLKKGASRPSEPAPSTVSHLGILGAGQMGAALAFCAARQGIEVTLLDRNQEVATRGLEYAKRCCEKDKRMDATRASELVARIHPAADYGALSTCDFVIEAVFEDRRVKAEVTAGVEAQLQQDTVFASNTSALPITDLADACNRPHNFIGMHFFSPAEKMPLVEIICGQKTSQEALAKAFDLAMQLQKTPIVVQDAPGFFTTRVIGATILQGAALLVEGINPILIENAAHFNGSPVGPLAIVDEISQATAYKNGKQNRLDLEARGETYVEKPANIAVRRMVEEFDRQGKAYGGGYYEYHEDGSKTLWGGLKEHFAPQGYTDIPFEDIKDRLMFSQVLEALRAMQEGVIKSAGDGNIGSIMGIGFPAHTGGVFQFVNSYGSRELLDRCRYLAERYGEEFEPPALLEELAETQRELV
ncbi:3-hydroxyacyl-CoA dehydrogenase [Pseudomaricurvus alkylphenolicus]|jgi:3-hydroxyacyl-CoA dehydrogenase/enoyl-CoA hydratase/3-hydroxybutyryl-CoA epimerase|uniref:3-hydroxyacyl-CoA dehydrogenase NAD-binding domain-containing protein n=1 Tax=Pseudomaricurvus alkylphenolicus TaxID=1306991 RepID=UPI001421B058|nr:3-hydroxyacyl-CoA dehydrogenase NAD-binding domain-containing protein [Pseudomaricurvus alkylphenolicus]NIB45007.1 3-hydroxyacyl-CoA dehydrogenase [Pseudomaricurvus alkylphenolicus]